MAFYLIAVLRLRESRHGREIVFLWARGCGLCLPLLPVAKNGRDTRTRHVRFRKGRKMYGGGVRPKLSNL
jgi:hypothetical protein